MANTRLGFRRLSGLDRSGGPPPETQRGAPLRPLTIPNAIGYARIAALIAFVDVPIVWYSIRWWRTQHPQPMTLPPQMWSALLWNWLALILLMTIVVLLRLRQEEMQREIDGLRRLAHAV